MIVVLVELWSAVDGSREQLARMHIANDGVATRANPRVGDYAGETFVGRSAPDLAKLRVLKRGQVRGWRRHDWHVWNLVARMLEQMGYDKGRQRASVAKRPGREDLARIIDPHAWEMAEACPLSGGSPWTADSLAKADRILDWPKP